MKLTSEFTKHVELAQQEHEYYISATKKSETQLAIAAGTGSSPDYAHYTFAEVFIPHHARQVGPLYFRV